MIDFKYFIIGCIEKYDDFKTAGDWLIKAQLELNEIEFQQLSNTILDHFLSHYDFVTAEKICGIAHWQIFQDIHTRLSQYYTEQHEAELSQKVSNINSFKDRILDSIEQKQDYGTAKFWFIKAKNKYQNYKFQQLMNDVLNYFLSRYDFVTADKINSKFDEVDLTKIYYERRQYYKKNTLSELEELFVKDHESEAEQFYKQHHYIISESEYDNSFQRYKKNIASELSRFLIMYRFHDAEQFYIKHRNLITVSDYQNQVNKALISQQQQFAIEQAQSDFIKLANKYNVDINKVIDESGPTLLSKILTKLEDEIMLDKSEIDWLEHNKIDELLAKYLYSLNLKFGHSTDDAIWNLSRASKFFRRAGLPEKAIKITDDFSDRIITNTDTLIRNPSASGAVYTSRGGAFRDMHNFGKAKECAREAIRVSPNSFYPYSLLGGISYDEGMPEDAERYFQKAVELGAKQDDQDREIRGVLKNEATDFKTRKTIIEYLLNKDPKKYDWVQQFQLQ